MVNSKQVNYYELEEKINELVNSSIIIKNIGIKEIVKNFEIPISVIKRQIKIRENEIKINIKNEKKVKKYYDMPSWEDKTRCPLCNAKLVKKWEGLVCTNNCPLNFKLGKGWVYLQKDSGWSNSRFAINSIMGTNKRNYLQQRFSKIKKEILIRDNYKCRACGYSLDLDFFYNNSKKLEVHHIIPAHEEMALYLDKDNLITLCEDCHNKIHINDKHSFSKIGGDDGISK